MGRSVSAHRPASSRRRAATSTLRYFHGRGWDHVATISSTDASGQAFDASVDHALASRELQSIKLVDREHFNVTDLNVEAQMARIKADAPQAVIEWTAGAAFATLLRGTQDVGLEVPIAGGNGNMQFSQLDGYRTFMPRELLFPTVSATTIGGAAPGPIHDTQQTYFEIFKRAGLKPDAQNNTIWDPALLIVSAYRAIGPDATAQQIQEYLQHLHSWTGTDGIYDFRDGSQRGIGIGVGVVARWDPKRDVFTSVSKLGGYPK
jgi:ABC-type branched-subunit amino acid transport system substrate-binding protein